MLSQVKLVGLGAILASALPLLGAGTADVPLPSPQASERLEGSQAPEEANGNLSEQDQAPGAGEVCQPPLFVPPGWEQRQLNFQFPIVVPKGFPIPSPSGFGAIQPPSLPAPPCIPAPFTMPHLKWTLPEPEPGSVKVEEEIETDQFGNQWVIRKKTWSSNGMVGSEVSRGPYTGPKADNDSKPSPQPTPAPALAEPPTGRLQDLKPVEPETGSTGQPLTAPGLPRAPGKPEPKI